MWSIYTMEYYSATRKNEIMLFAVIRMDLEIIIQNEVSKKKTDTIGYHICVGYKI